MPNKTIHPIIITSTDNLRIAKVIPRCDKCECYTESIHQTFEKELRALMKKYEVKITEYEHYDQEENNIGSTYAFTGEGIAIPLEELQD